MAEVVGLAASIVQVAAFGLTLSRTLHDYGSSVVGAEKRLKGLDKDIKFTSQIILQLGASLQKPEVQALVAEDTIRLTQDVLAECDAIFHAMEDVVDRIRNSGMGKWTIYFRESKIELMRANLDRMKGNLQLLLGVIVHGTQMAGEQPDDALLSAHRARIRELMLEKEHYTQRYLEEKRRYDELLAKVNSTSTINTILTIQSIEAPRLDDEGTLPQQSHGDLSAPGSNMSPPHATSSTPKLPSCSEARNGPHGNHETVSQGPMLELTSLSSASREIRHQQVEASATPNRLTLFASPAAPMSQTAPIISTLSPAPALETTETRRQRRDRILKAAKKAARVSGIAIALAAGVALFPISLPVYLYYRRRARRRLHSDQCLSFPVGHQWSFYNDPEYRHNPPRHALGQPALPPDWHFPHSAPGPTPMLASPTSGYSPQNVSPGWQRDYASYGSGYCTQASYHPSAEPYSSAQLRAELPAIHELADASVPVELGLINRLTRSNFMERPES